MLGHAPVSAAPLAGHWFAPVYVTSFSWPMMWTGSGAPLGWVNTDAGDVEGVTEPDEFSVEFWSGNPALCTADFMVKRGDLITDWDYVASAANRCDEQVSGAGGTEARCTMTLALATKRPVRDWLETLRAYIPAWIVDAGGSWRIVADIPRATDHFFGPATIDSNPPPEITRTGTRDTPNAVDVSYTDEQTIPWELAPATAEFDDDDVRRSAVSLPGIRRYSQAYRFAVERLNHYTLEDVVGKMSVFDYGLKVLPGDVAQVSEAAFGWTARPVRILAASDKGNGRWDLEFREYDPLAYSDTVQISPSIPESSLSSPLEVAPPSAFAIVEVLTPESNLPAIGVGSSIIYQSRIRATWTDSLDPYVSHYMVHVTRGGTEVMQQRVERGVGAWLSQPVQQLVTYTVELRAVNSLGVLSAPLSASLFIDGKKFPPSDVPAITQALEIGGDVLLTWQPASDFDAIRYEWRVDLGNVGLAWEAMMVLDATDSLHLRRKGLPEGTHRFCVRALDSVQNYSLNSKCVLITVTSDANSFLRDHEFCTPTVVGMLRTDIALDEEESPSLRPRWITNDISRSWNASMPSPINAGAAPVFSYGAGAAVTPSWRGESYDLGFELTAQFSVTARTTIWGGAVTQFLEHSLDGVAWTQVDVSVTPWIGTARFIRPFLQGSLGASFMIEGCVKVGMTSNGRSESGQSTSSASGPTTITLANQYSKAISIVITPLSNDGRAWTVDNVVVGIGAPSHFDVYIFDGADAQTATPFLWKFEGV